MTPVDAAYTGAEFEAANKMVPISRKIDAETSVIFFKNYTRILVLLEKAVGLRLAIVRFLNMFNPISSYSQSSPQCAHDSLLSHSSNSVGKSTRHCSKVSPWRCIDVRPVGSKI